MKKIIGLVSLFFVLVFVLAQYTQASPLEDVVNRILSASPSVKGVAIAGTSTGDKTPRIMYWSGKVNQYVDSDGIWRTDPDGSSSATINKLTYCKKWFPDTVSVEDYMNETINTWRAGGNVGAYTSTKMSTKCVQEGDLVPVISLKDLLDDNYLKSKYDNKEIILEGFVASNDFWRGGTDKLKSISLYSEIYTSSLKVSKWIDSDIEFTNIMSLILKEYNKHNPLPGFMKVKIKGTLYKDNLAYHGFSIKAKELIHVSGVFDNSSQCPLNFPSPVLCPDGKTYSKIEPKSRDANNCVTGYSFICPSDPSITVTSPNGGETYKLGDKITVKWKSENIGYNNNVRIILNGKISQYELASYSSNDGEEIVTLPSYFADALELLGKNFSISVGIGNSLEYVDWSDNTFTITSDLAPIINSGCHSGNIYSATTGLKCPPTSLHTIDSGCSLGNLYSATTGQKCPIQEQVCCESYGIGAYGVRTESNYSVVPKSECSVCKFDPATGLRNCMTGGGRNIIAMNYCTSKKIIDNQCDLGYKFSPTTGMKCFEGEDVGCLAGYKFSPKTGRACQAPNANANSSISTNSNTNSQQIQAQVNNQRTLRRGDRGEDVKALQRYLNLVADGVYGSQTSYAVGQWQRNNGITPDGVFGPRSFNLLYQEMLKIENSQ